MIEPAEADIGRAVVYDCRPIIKRQDRGIITGIDGRCVWVKFDFADGPIKVFSNLRWAAVGSVYPKTED